MILQWPETESSCRQAKKNEFVFSAYSDAGHVMDPRKAMLKVAELAEIDFTVHDLRRTFITTAESLDIPAYALKRLLNHKMNHDVTAGYIVMDVERLRKPMQKITDCLLKCMKVKKAWGKTLGEGKRRVPVNDAA